MLEARSAATTPERKGGSDMAEPTLVQKTYTAVVKHLIRTGRAPHYTELAEILGLQPDEARGPTA